MDRPIIRKYGLNGILMEWKAEISPEINEVVVRMMHYLKETYAEIIDEVVPSYQSLLIFLKKSENVQEHIAILRYSNIPKFQYSSTKNCQTWKIPVCYDSSFGFDLEGISRKLKLSREKIIQLHTNNTYRIYGMGFLPGFLYLGGLNQQLCIPRKVKIAQIVPKGSVAIGGAQTGIYPQNSPGGWHVIGRTPIELFNINENPPSFFSVGDSIQFESISLTKFEALRTEIDSGRFKLNHLRDD